MDINCWCKESECRDVLIFPAWQEEESKEVSALLVYDRLILSVTRVNSVTASFEKMRLLDPF